MTKLLVSVRDADEARVAVDAGVDLIDVKEPVHGSLGASDPAIWREVISTIAGRTPISVALGELLQSSESALASLPLGCQYAKVGLAGCGPDPHWIKCWEECLQAFPAHVQAVAVIYADWQACAAPPPQLVLERARCAGCAAVLVDTSQKRGNDLLHYIELPTLAQWTESVHRHGMQMVLGGSLTSSTIQRVLPLMPDYVAVRGAVCHTARTSRIDPGRVRALVQLLDKSPSAPRE